MIKCYICRKITYMLTENNNNTYDDVNGPDDSRDPEDTHAPREANGPDDSRNPGDTHVPREANGPDDPDRYNRPDDPREANGPDDSRNPGDTHVPREANGPDDPDRYNRPDDPGSADQVNESGGTYQPREPLSFEKVWLMFRETREQMQASFKETDRKWQETDKRFKETDRILKEQSKETDRKLQEAAGLISELREEYKNRWGELVESLVSGSLLRILKAHNIPVSKVSRRRKNFKGEPNYELDIVASNGDEVVVVEVKSVLNPEAVKHFISQLNLVRNRSRRFRNQRIIGAVAFLTDHSDAAFMAMNRGLLAIRATGDSAIILNDDDFEPVRF